MIKHSAIFIRHTLSTVVQKNKLQSSSYIYAVRVFKPIFKILKLPIQKTSHKNHVDNNTMPIYIQISCFVYISCMGRWKHSGNPAVIGTA